MDRGIGNDEKVLISSNVEDIKFRINTAEHGSELEFRLLEMILSKTFTLLFMLNGGAAVALLAFWGSRIVCYCRCTFIYITKLLLPKHERKHYVYGYDFTDRGTRKNGPVGTKREGA